MKIIAISYKRPICQRKTICQ